MGSSYSHPRAGLTDDDLQLFRELFFKKRFQGLTVELIKENYPQFACYSNSTVQHHLDLLSIALPLASGLYELKEGLETVENAVREIMQGKIPSNDAGPGTGLAVQFENGDALVLDDDQWTIVGND